MVGLYNDLKTVQTSFQTQQWQNHQREDKPGKLSQRSVFYLLGHYSGMMWSRSLTGDLELQLAMRPKYGLGDRTVATVSGNSVRLDQTQLYVCTPLCASLAADL